MAAAPKYPIFRPQATAETSAIKSSNFASEQRFLIDVMVDSEVVRAAKIPCGTSSGMTTW